MSDYMSDYSQADVAIVRVKKCKKANRGQKMGKMPNANLTKNSENWLAF